MFIGTTRSDAVGADAAKGAAAFNDIRIFCLGHQRQFLF